MNNQSTTSAPFVRSCWNEHEKTSIMQHTPVICGEMIVEIKRPSLSSAITRLAIAERALNDRRSIPLNNSAFAVVEILENKLLELVPLKAGDDRKS